MSRLQTKLNAALSAYPDRQEWARIKTRLAIYYYQKGESKKGDCEVAEVRSWLNANNDTRSMVCVNLAEATKLFQSGITIEAILKVRRAHAVSSAVSHQDLVSFSSAWLAHLEFNEGRYASSIHFLGESLRRVDVSDSFVLARTFSLIADIYNFCGDFQAANPWYKRARNAAVDDGDEIMLGQIIYNSATCRLNSVRVSLVLGLESTDDLKVIKLMIDSTSNFDLGVRSTAFQSLLPMLNAQILMIQGDFFEASKLFGQWFKSRDLAVDPRMISLCRADYAVCLMRIQKSAEALEQANELDSLSITALPPDEQSIIFHQLSMLYGALGDVPLSKHNEFQARREIQRHVETSRETLRELTAMINGNLAN